MAAKKLEDTGGLALFLVATRLRRALPQETSPLRDLTNGVGKSIRERKQYGVNSILKM